MICDSSNEVTDYYIAAIEPRSVMSLFIEDGIMPGRTNSDIGYPFTKRPTPAS
jgi:hypothetical protein